MATRGAGKSWLAAVRGEKLIEAGYPILVLNAVGEYYSLKAKYPIVVYLLDLSLLIKTKVDENEVRIPRKKRFFSGSEHGGRDSDPNR